MSKIYFINQDCFDTMKRMEAKDYKVDIVLTSPPYNTARTCKTQKSLDTYNNRYDVLVDNKTDEEYSQWTVNLFNEFDKILEKNGTVIYNVSYGSENPNVMWIAIGDLIKNTNFMVADCITWKKASALPNNVSPNKLTRITEFVLIFCRKNEFTTFNANKKVKSISKTGQKYYENVFNFIVAKNNDGTCKLNKATYSSELCEKLLEIYAKEGCKVYDPFMGTGTTAIACEKMGFTCFGSEISEAQVQFSTDRLNKFREDNSNKQTSLDL